MAEDVFAAITLAMVKCVSLMLCLCSCFYLVSCLLLLVSKTHLMSFDNFRRTNLGKISVLELMSSYIFYEIWKNWKIGISNERQRTFFSDSIS